MKKLVTAAVLLGLASASYANEGEVKDRHGFYGHIGYYKVDLDPARQAGDYDALGAGLGWFFNKNWAVEIPYTQGDVYTNYDNRMFKHRVENVGLDLMYNDTDFLGGVNTHPYIKLGVGKHNVKNNPWGAGQPSPEADEYYKVGLGIQHFATDTVFIRAGLDLLDGSEEQQDDKMWYFNVGAFFGETVRTEATAPVVEKEAKDSDGDGVLDADDRCPGTPAGVSVDANGCPLDSDGDGVADYKDACPGTAAGVQVDEKGCEVKVAENVVVDMRLNFDTNKYAIKPEMVSEIAKVAEFLRQYPNVNAQIQGHTDSVGAASYNQGLSERRANSVKNYLVENFGIDAGRLSTVGYGENNPIADNATAEGRALNRRAEAHAETN